MVTDIKNGKKSDSPMQKCCIRFIGFYKFSQIIFGRWSNFLKHFLRLHNDETRALVAITISSSLVLYSIIINSTKKLLSKLFNVYWHFVVKKIFRQFSNFQRKRKYEFNLGLFGSSNQRCFIKKTVLKSFTKFTGKHLCQSLFLSKVAGLSVASEIIRKPKVFWWFQGE